MIIKHNIFRGDLSDISAKTATLAPAHSAVRLMNLSLRYIDPVHS